MEFIQEPIHAAECASAIRRLATRIRLVIMVGGSTADVMDQLRDSVKDVAAVDAVGFSLGGADAYEVCRSLRPDVVTLTRFTVEDAADVIRDIRLADSSARACVFTPSSFRDELKAPVLAAGALEFLDKAFDDRTRTQPGYVEAVRRVAQSPPNTKPIWERPSRLSVLGFADAQRTRIPSEEIDPPEERVSGVRRHAWPIPKPLEAGRGNPHGADAFDPQCLLDAFEHIHVDDGFTADCPPLGPWSPGLRSASWQVAPSVPLGLTTDIVR